jgi:hypothetical protein
MRAAPVYAYQGYIVDVYYLPEPGGQYSSIFSLRQGAPLSKKTWHPNFLTYTEGRNAAAVCKTLDEAHQAATERANRWIEQNPVDTI